MTTERASTPNVSCMAGSSSRWREVRQVSQESPHVVQIEPDPVLAAVQDHLWVPETRPWSLTCRDVGRC